MAKSLGRALGEFKRATNDLKESISVDPDIKDVKNTFNEINAEIKDSFTSDPTKSDTAAALREADPKAPETRDDPAVNAAKSSDSDKMNDLKKAFQEMNAESGSEKVSSTQPEEQPAGAQDDKKDSAESDSNT